MTNAEPDGQPDQETNEQRVVLLPDEPSGTDEFHAQAHDNVANAIADLVGTEPGGRVIGLEGSWGSGKSTVIELLRKRLKTDRRQEGSRVLPIVFDAWAHQGDPLRRTFLEKVIDELSASDWLPAADAGKFRTRLAGRTSKVRTKATARLSLEGRLASAAAVLLPLGAVLLGNDFEVHHGTAQIAGFLLLLGPLLVVLGFLLAKATGILTGGKKQRTGTRRALADIHAFSFFANEQETDTTTEGIERSEPTSVEFEKLFSDILSASLTEGRRLLVVLDNLDRVEEADAKTVLATMQTFTGAADLRSASWAKSVWTLIPYDPVGLDRLWATAAAGHEDADESKALTTPTSLAFVEKVFQVRFEAPPLVLSDWRSYLHRLLSESLPSTSNDDLDAVLRLRALYPGVEGEGLVAQEAPTPRQLKQFVNQIGAVCRQRDDIPLIHVAYYALLRRDRIDVASRLLSSDDALPHTKLAHLFQESIQDDLAALHFGTTQSLAQQLVLGRALDRAFASGDAEVVEKLKESAGFADALECLDLASRVADGGIELTRTVAVLSEAGALDLPTVATWAKAHLEPIARSNQAWALAGAETGIGLAVLFDRLSKEDDPALTELLTRVEPGPSSADENGHLQLEGAAGLADELIRRGRRKNALRIKLDVPPERLVESVSYFGSHTKSRQSSEALELGSSPDEVAHAVGEAAYSGDHGDVSAALDVLLTRPERVDLASLASLCLEWLRQNDAGSAEQLGTLLDVVDRARRAGVADDVLGSAADDGSLMHQLSVANRSEWYAQAGSASMLQLMVRPGLPEPEPSREAPSGTQTLRAVLTGPDGYSDIVAGQQSWLSAHANEAVNALIAIANGDKAFRPWVEAQLRKLAEDSVLVVSPTQFQTNWKYFNRVLGGDEFAELTRRQLSKAQGRKKILERTDDPALAIAALSALGSEESAEYATEIRHWARDTVNVASVEDWQASLSDANGGALLDLALQLADTEEAPADPSGLADALHTHFQALADGESVWQPEGDRFTKLARLLGAPARRVLASQLCAELEGRSGDVRAALFTTYGDFLAAERTFRRHSKLPNVIERLVAHDAWDAVQWIVALAEEHPDTLQPADREDELAHLANKVNDKLAELSEDPPDALTKLAAILSTTNP